MNKEVAYLSLSPPRSGIKNSKKVFVFVAQGRESGTYVDMLSQDEPLLFLFPFIRHQVRHAVLLIWFAPFHRTNVIHVSLKLLMSDYLLVDDDLLAQKL